MKSSKADRDWEARDRCNEHGEAHRTLGIYLADIGDASDVWFR
jgi:hypothetical protein